MMLSPSQQFVLLTPFFTLVLMWEMLVGAPAYCECCGKKCKSKKSAYCSLNCKREIEREFGDFGDMPYDT